MDLLVVTSFSKKTYLRNTRTLKARGTEAVHMTLTLNLKHCSDFSNDNEIN